MQNLAAKWIHHTHRAIAHRPHHWMIHPPALDQFVNQYELIDQGDYRVSSEKASIAIFHLAWVRDDTVQTLSLEIVVKEDKFAVGGHFAPVQNSNLRRFTSPRPLLIRIQQRMQHAMPGWQRAHLMPPQKLAHQRQGIEDLCERIIVRRSGRRFSVILRQTQAALLRHKKRIHPRSWAGRAEAGIMLHQFLFPIGQTELGAQPAILQRHVIGALESAQHPLHARLKKTILLNRNEARAQNCAERALSKEEAAPLKLIVKLCLGISYQRISQQ